MKTFQEEIEKNINGEISGLIRKMLIKDPNQRPSAQQILEEMNKGKFSELTKKVLLAPRKKSQLENEEEMKKKNQYQFSTKQILV